MQPSRTLQLKVTAAFAAVTLGFVGAAGYVPLAVWSFAIRAEGIQERYADELRELGQIRGCEREIRRGAILAFHATSEAERVAQETAVAQARQRCAALVAVHSRRMAGGRGLESDTALARWQHFLAHDLPEHEAATDAVLAESRATAPDAAAVRQLFNAAADGDAQLESMMALHAATAEADAGRIHSGLDRLSFAYVVLALVGAIGAIILLVESVRLLRRYARSAEERVAELEAFAGRVAHDLRGPLQTIQLTVATIAKQSPEPAVQRLASGATVAVKRLERMIRDLLQFARSGAAAADGAATNVAAVVGATCEALRPQAERLRVKLTLEADPHAHARVAPVALETMVSNLVENALKYGRPDHENEVAVTVASIDREMVRIVVRDRGTGIGAEILPRVFEPFVCGSKRPDSYGLGLFTVKRLVDAHRGKIAVESVEGRGTTFSILLPAARFPAVHAAACAAGASSPAGEPPPSPTVQDVAACSPEPAAERTPR